MALEGNNTRWFTKYAGEADEKLVPLEQVNVLPSQYEAVTGMPAETLYAVLLFLCGHARDFWA
jgi:hypothetical protein